MADSILQPHLKYSSYHWYAISNKQQSRPDTNMKVKKLLRSDFLSTPVPLQLYLLCLLTVPIHLLPSPSPLSIFFIPHTSCNQNTIPKMLQQSGRISFHKLNHISPIISRLKIPSSIHCCDSNYLSYLLFIYIWHH